MNSLLSFSSTTPVLSQLEQEHLLEKLEVFKVQGRDKCGRQVVRVIGKIFPARLVSREVLKKYLEDKIFPQLKESPFSVVYVHTGVQRCKNFPGISALRSIYDAIPMNIRDRLEAVYFLHPSLQVRLFLATFGRLLFSGRLYEKVKYVNRLEFLWEHVKRKEIVIPEFVNDHDGELEYRPMMMTYYGLESDHPRIFCAPSMDSSVSMFSMRCIA
ncbi:hypothetical protein ACOSP7_011225 [Xanthoceras sorbifolium]|uniref:CRAL-TRIO domain-containing protein n=1 Tax=Xanthoceras sorbifolium TaxID=99658 RepID=A0ABQ8H009_9ROSI|nr:hypothetical protein JRO89_XSUnG0038600 [Xanthoceras sorbifolium]